MTDRAKPQRKPDYHIGPEEPRDLMVGIYDVNGYEGFLHFTDPRIAFCEAFNQAGTGRHATPVSVTDLRPSQEIGADQLKPPAQRKG